jgi:hypothetical protein
MVVIFGKGSGGKEREFCMKSEDENEDVCAYM